MQQESKQKPMLVMAGLVPAIPPCNRKTLNRNV
jgi:hypothetical protein